MEHKGSLPYKIRGFYGYWDRIHGFLSCCTICHMMWVGVHINPEDGGSLVLLNVSIHPSHYMAH